MNLESALIKRVLECNDFDTWMNVRKHYLPSEYHSLFTVIDKHCENNHNLPTFEELKVALARYLDPDAKDMTPVAKEEPVVAKSAASPTATKSAELKSTSVKNMIDRIYS